MMDVAQPSDAADHQETAIPAASSRTADQLVKQAQQGDLEAFTLLYEQHLSVVYRRVRYVIPAEDVEDVTQEIFISVLKSLRGFKGDAKFRTWLRTLTDRRVADYYKQRERRDSREEAVESDPVASLLRSRDPLSSNLDEKILLRRALRELPVHYQEIILLRFADGLMFQQIAVEMGLSLEAAKSLYRRAIASLKDELDDRR